MMNKSFADEHGITGLADIAEQMAESWGTPPAVIEAGAYPWVEGDVATVTTAAVVFATADADREIVRAVALAAACATGQQRRLEGWRRTAVRAYAAALVAWTVFAAVWSHLDVPALTMTFLAQMLVLVFVLITPAPAAERTRVP